MTDLPASTGSSSLPLPAHPHHHPHHLHPVGASGKKKKHLKEFLTLIGICSSQKNA
jgi:hypothetical protein